MEFYRKLEKLVIFKGTAFRIFKFIRIWDIFKFIKYFILLTYDLKNK